jgi:hypothetical protein
VGREGGNDLWQALEEKAAATVPVEGQPGGGGGIVRQFPGKIRT